MPDRVPCQSPGIPIRPTLAERLPTAIEIVEKESLPIVFDTKSITEAAEGPATCAILDFDQDGDLDVLVGGYNIALFENSGNGEFKLYKDLKTQGHTSAIGSGDFNGDGKTDIAAIDTGNPEDGKGFLSVFYGKKNGKSKKIILRPGVDTILMDIE